MPRIAYEHREFEARALNIIKVANGIIAEYARQGFQLSLRQLYYQFVARGLLANKQTQYSRLGSIINDARLSGLVDWLAIEDRSRELESVAHWEQPSDIIDAVARQFRIDKWEGQEHRPEVWIEKDALTGVIDPICKELDLAYFSCRGYTSQSEMWKAGAVRFREYAAAGQNVVLLHFGDHDPSGIDMSRDIESRIRMFMEEDEDRFEFRRLALNADQIELYNPPPNPVKLTDSRSGGYQAKFGDTSWELDALEPSVIAALIRNEVADLRDDGLWDEKVEEEEEHRRALKQVSDRWSDVVTHLEKEEE